MRAIAASSDSSILVVRLMLPRRIRFADFTTAHVRFSSGNLTPRMNMKERIVVVRIESGTSVGGDLLRLSIRSNIVFVALNPKSNSGTFTQREQEVSLRVHAITTFQTTITATVAIALTQFVDVVVVVVVQGVGEQLSRRFSSPPHILSDINFDLSLSKFSVSVSFQKFR